MSKLEFINKVLFQWFFCRIARFIDEEYEWYEVIYFILPTTGWKKDYVIVLSKTGFFRHFRISKRKKRK